MPKVDGDILYDGDANTTAGNCIDQVEAGEAITAGNVVYIHLTDGKAYVSDTGTANDIRADGIALNTASAGADVTILTRGLYSTTGLTDKEDYYLGASGALSTTRSGVRIGTAVSTTALFVHVVQDDRDSVGTIKPLTPSLSGTPSNNITAFWKACDGSTLSDTESPFNGVALPNLNGTTDSTRKFLRGSTTSGTETSTATHTHTGTTDGSSGGSGAGGSGTASPPPSHTHTFTTDSTSHIPPSYTVTFYIKVK